jgi:hypothetical protein
MNEAIPNDYFSFLEVIQTAFESVKLLVKYKNIDLQGFVERV